MTSAVLDRADVASDECARTELFRALVDENQDAAIRTAGRLLGGDPAAEDVAQEAFLRAYKGLSGFRGDSSLRTWFFRILVREVQRHRRWQAVRHVFRTESLSERELPGASPPAGDAALRARITGALEGLPRRQREAFVLVHLEEFTVKEAASLLDVSLGTIKVHLHRARKALRARLADLADLEAPDDTPDNTPDSAGSGDAAPATFESEAAESNTAPKGATP